MSDIVSKLSTGKARKSFGPNVTDQQALQFGCRASGFHVGVRHRDEKVRRVANKLCKLGLFSRKRHKRYGDGTTFKTTESGRNALAELNKLSTSED